MKVGAARSFELIDIQETRIGALAGQGERRIDIPLAVLAKPPQHHVFRRERGIPAHFPLQAQGGLEGVGSTDARVYKQHAGSLIGKIGGIAQQGEAGIAQHHLVQVGAVEQQGSRFHGDGLALVENAEARPQDRFAIGAPE